MNQRKEALRASLDLRVLAAQRRLGALVQNVGAVANGLNEHDPALADLRNLVKTEGRPMMELFTRIDRLVTDQPKRLASVLGPYFAIPPFPPKPVPGPGIEPDKGQPTDEAKAGNASAGSTTAGSNEGANTPSGTPDGSQPGQPGVSPPPIPVNACPYVNVRAVELEVQRATIPQALDDNVAINMVGAQTAGVPAGTAAQPQQERWPDPKTVGDSVKVANGASISPTADLRFQAAAIGGSCYIQMVVSITLWEVDAGQIDRALKESARKLKSFALGLATLLPGGGLITAADDAGLFEALFNELMNLIGLGDDWMGTMSFFAAGKLTSTTAMKNLFWFPEPKVTGTPIQYDFPTDRTAVLQQDFSRSHGLWKLTVHVSRSP